ISAEVERVALALDSKSIAVLLPLHQRTDPASWIRDVQVTPVLMESNEARVTINRKTGTIVVTGDTRISDVVVSQLGMTITVANPLADGSILPLPAFEEHDFVALDDPEHRLPNVQDLLQALNRLKVPFKNRIAILEEIHRAGKLHARILYEG
ncbi:MAG: flagellar basal body P-ring protein FlgI, partial [Planctomycetes bacterium]|nr:flagellar basal body P-ring protein FlgI [Planctomycetota bacterium]